MIQIEIVLHDGKRIPAKIRERHYKYLVINSAVKKVKDLTFWERIKILFKKGNKT
jgi:hypothetical protein